MSEKKTIAILGSGNWGSAIAKIIGENVKSKPHIFEPTVNMWVFEEIFEGRRLSEIINTEHVNRKYLPDSVLPDNVVAVTDSLEAVGKADLIVFVMPHQFVEKICKPLRGKLKKGVLGISLIKGVSVSKEGITLFSEVISEILDIEVGVLSGANVAKDVASANFCESTIAFKNKESAKYFLEAIQNDRMRINVISDVAGAQLCGALKNVVAIIAGTSDGLGYGPNTKAAVIRLGMTEIISFMQAFFDRTSDSSTLFESCGIADLVVTCYAGRNRLAAETHAKTGKSFKVLEKELLGGQSLQGMTTAKELHEFLVEMKLQEQYPIFETAYKICYENLPPRELLNHISNKSLKSANPN